MKLLFYLKKQGQCFFQLLQNAAWHKVFCGRERGPWAL